MYDWSRCLTPLVTCFPCETFITVQLSYVTNQPLSQPADHSARGCSSLLLPWCGTAHKFLGALRSLLSLSPPACESYETSTPSCFWSGGRSLWDGSHDAWPRRPPAGQLYEGTIDFHLAVAPWYFSSLSWWLMHYRDEALLLLPEEKGGRKKKRESSLCLVFCWRL